MILPNIETALKIHVTKHNDQFRADPTTLPGSPICGTGNTEDAVKYNLCVNYLYLIANYYSQPERPHGGDYGYVPIIIKLLQENYSE